MSTIITIKGAGKGKRELAFGDIATYAFCEAQSRGVMLATIRVALGSKPTANELDVARREFIIGRAAFRLAPVDLPKGCVEGVDRVAYARRLVMTHAAPVKDGTTARKLRKGQEGRRTVAQHKAIRAAEEAWSLVKGELGLGNARTLAEKNKRQAATKGSTNRGKGSPAPTHSQLVQPVAPMNAADACGHIATQAASLLAFCNKNAKLVPTGFGAAVIAFKKAIDAADAERRVADSVAAVN